MADRTRDMADTADQQRSTDGHLVRSPRRWLFGAVLVMAVYTVGLVVVGIEDAVGAVMRASLLPLIGALLLQVAVVVLWGQVYRASAAAANGSIGIRDALRVSMPAFTLSHTLPGGGVTGNAVAIHRLTAQGMNGPSAAAAVTLAATISLSTIAGLGSAGILTAFLAGDLPILALVIALPILVALLVLLATVVAVLHSPSAGDRAVGRIGKLHHRLGKHVHEWRGSLREVTEEPPEPRQLVRIVGWSLGKWAADIASLALVFHALGTTPRISALLVSFGVTQLATAIPVAPGGVGFVEAGMVVAFVTLGYPSALAASVVLAYRVIETWLPTLAGVPRCCCARSPPRTCPHPESPSSGSCSSAARSASCWLDSRCS